MVKEIRVLVSVAVVTLGVVAVPVALPVASQAGNTCRVPKATVAYGPWRVTIKSFTRDASKLLKPPAGRVLMAAEVVVSNTEGGSPGLLLDINLQPTGARRYRGTVIKGEFHASQTLKPNEKATYTVGFPVELKDKGRELSIELNDFSGAVSAEKLIKVC
jgi:hypothetical protein